MGDEGDYVPVSVAAERLGMGRQALWRKIKQLDIPTYRTGRDGRLRLVSLAEVRRAFAPVPATPVAQSEGESNGD